MTYGLELMFALLYGLALGLLYFGGLWYTVRRAHDARRPKSLLLGSFLLRSVLVLSGFYLIIYLTGHRWEMVALGGLGFLGGRRILVRRLRPDTTPASITVNAVDHGD